ncbi:sulfite exporter TauE/SafE family protein [Reyranella sp.]|jgi:hypothetical protein|uniref:sulfite exporter TauE/SafE family protein n=1 Tax=Reyranella sp. TaxID=1929291 RepID=UPI002F92EE9C
MRPWLAFAPLIGAALFGNAIRPVPTTDEEAEACADFERSLGARVAAARTARARTIGVALRTPAIRRRILRGAALLGLAAYAFVLAHLQGPTVSFWAMAAVFAAALASSIAGFAFSAICGAMLFHLIDDPVAAVQIMMICSLGGQALMTFSLRRAICWRALVPFALGAAVGLPIGLHILLHMPTALFTRVIGGLLVLYGGWMIVQRPIVIARQHAAFDAAAGILGGITGGAAAFPGAFVTIWCGLKGWSKERQRGVYQPFILLVQLAAIALMAAPGIAIDPARHFAFVGVEYLPAMFLGCAAGMGFFRWLSERQFALGVNALLLVSGASLLV